MIFVSYFSDTLMPQMLIILALLMAGRIRG
uniref:Uncharacterized protein n=1 Tax=Arundo donax TaxID=35708 RepID=A0A0A9FI72_ARUDO